MHFFTSSRCFWMALTLHNLKLGGNLEFSWYSCNILRYCSNRCIVWFFILENCPAQANRKFPVQLYVKIQILLESPFWICKWANHLSFLAMIPPRHPPYFIPLSLLPLHHLFTILPPSSLSFSLYSFLPALFLIPVSCAFKHLANLSFSHLH